MDKIKEIVSNWGVFITLLGLLGIEISPIKINPIKWCLKTLGKAINSELNDKIDIISEKVNKMQKNCDFKDIQDIKNHLSDMHITLLSIGLTEDQYRRCFELEEKYIYYKNKYPGEVNGHMDAILESIHSNYKAGNILNLQKPKKCDII